MLKEGDQTALSMNSKQVTAHYLFRKSLLTKGRKTHVSLRKLPRCVRVEPTGTSATSQIGYWRTGLPYRTFYESGFAQTLHAARTFMIAKRPCPGSGALPPITVFPLDFGRNAKGMEMCGGVPRQCSEEVWMTRLSKSP